MLKDFINHILNREAKLKATELTIACNNGAYQPMRACSLLFAFLSVVKIFQKVLKVMKVNI